MLCPKMLPLRMFLIVSFLQVIHCLFKGDICYHQIKNSTGTCTILENCQSAIADLRKRINPQTCGFDGAAPIVCCVGDPSSSISTTDKPAETTQKSTVGIRSLQKCNEYKHYVFGNETLPLLIPGATQLTNKCEIDSAKLIIRDNRVRAKEFPHMALIGFDNDNEKVWECAGILISENYVLTAAHCLYSRNYGKPTVVRLGDLNVTDPSDDENVQQIRIKEHIAHPEYKPPSKYNDIALLLLETPANLGIFVRPACLYTKREYIQSAISTGWGFTPYGGKKSDKLMKVVLKLYTISSCNITYAGDSTRLSIGIDDATQLCAGYDQIEKEEICQQHSGGPLQIFSETYCMYDIIGVTSFGKFCGFVGIPTVFTKLYPYLQWIENTIWPLN